LGDFSRLCPADTCPYCSFLLKIDGMGIAFSTSDGKLYSLEVSMEVAAGSGDG
jgi:hypothetical protein